MRYLMTELIKTPLLNVVFDELIPLIKVQQPKEG